MIVDIQSQPLWRTPTEDPVPLAAACELCFKYQVAEVTSNTSIIDIPSNFLYHFEELRFAFPSSALFMFLLKQIRSRKSSAFEMALIRTLFMLFWNRLVICPCRIVWTNSLAAWCGDTSSTQLMNLYSFCNERKFEIDRVLNNKVSFWI